MKYKNEVKKIYQEFCKENKIKFHKKEFEDFLEFLEIDFYDRVKENLKCYFRDKKKIS